MTVRQIADNWRAFRPLQATSVNVRGIARPPFGSPLLRDRRIRRKVFPRWSLDWDAIRATPRHASFNVYNFTAQQLDAVPPAAMREDLLVAAGSLPIWFPVTIDGKVCVDAVHATNGNLRYAVDHGADELWIVWTTSTAGRWKNGPVGEYFNIFEEANNSRLRAELEDIERSNARLARGEDGTYGRPSGSACCRSRCRCTIC
jgi:hypothetical protein